MLGSTTGTHPMIIMAIIIQVLVLALKLADVTISTTKLELTLNLAEEMNSRREKLG
jgi:hypothetical protein